jgi:hypothetical protein
MNIQRFADFWRAMFFFVSTITVCVLLYLVAIVWQPVWSSGFKNFDNISRSIMRLDRTAKPVAEMAPLMLGQMDEIRKIMMRMDTSMKTMETLSPNMLALNYSMNKMTWVLSNQMGVMTGQMDQMKNKFSPLGMMPFNW